MAKYKVMSQEGADHYGAELESEIDLELEEQEETAVVAAGWLEKPGADKPAIPAPDAAKEK